MTATELQTNAFLQGEKVYLRPLALEDIDGPYVSWLNDAEVCRYNSHGVKQYTRALAEAYVNESRGSKNRLVLAVVLAETNSHIGNISLQSIDLSARSAEFAILMGDKSQWGKGLAKEAAFLVCQHGFSALNLNRIHCGTHSENIGMQKLAKYLGMQEEGRLRQSLYKSGVFSDVKLYAVLRDEFCKKFDLKKV